MTAICIKFINLTYLSLIATTSHRAHANNSQIMIFIFNSLWLKVAH